MPIDLDHLEALAKAATPGPWLERHEDVYSEVDAHVAFCLTVCSSADECCITKKQAQANAVFIAAANPAEVLELIATVRQAQAERDWLAEMVIAVHETGYCPPEGECPIVNANPDHGDCVKCWLNAARDAVEKEAKE